MFTVILVKWQVPILFMQMQGTVTLQCCQFVCKTSAVSLNLFFKCNEMC